MFLGDVDLGFVTVSGSLLLRKSIVLVVLVEMGGVEPPCTRC